MLQVSVLRANPEEVKKRLAVKHFKQPELVDTIIGLDDERKKLQLDFDTTQGKLNAASKEIGKLMGQGNKEAAEAMKAEVAGLKTSLEPIKEQMTVVEQTLLDTLLQLPNLPTTEVPEGRTPEENVVVREGGVIPALYEGAQPHWDLTKKYNLIDFELGNKITGSGFPVYIGKGAKLQRALIQYFLDFNTAAGYTEYLPPFMVNAASAMGTGQLPDKEGQMYYMPEDDFYMIPTS
jgi:seryl-tRNA synthetase